MRHFSRIFSAELEGISARLIEVETDISVGLHSFTIVGLADKALSESKERVNAALKNSGVKPPSQENRRITVNLAPADVKKTGSQYDLPVAIGYLLAGGQMGLFDTNHTLIVGELALNGAVRPVTGLLSIAQLARSHGITELIVPATNAAEAALVSGVRVTPVANLIEVIRHLEGKNIIPPQPLTDVALSPEDFPFETIHDIKGQQTAKRALIIAASGGHNLLMIGPPGAGKTMLAQALTSLLPRPSTEEMLEVTQIYSSAGLLRNRPFIAHRPFRAPHQTASPVAVIGGGSSPRPGEISLAHRGVLFLDELPEFRRDLLESLRQPLESGHSIVTRAKGSLTFPARFMLVAAMNPCPCGYHGDSEKACQCSAYEVIKYQKKVSGPLLDRIDLQIAVPRVKVEELQQGAATEALRSPAHELVCAARERQRQRLSHLKRSILVNSEMNSKEVDALIELDSEAKAFIGQIFNRSLISARGYYRILKTARTIADLEPSEQVCKRHVAEAFSYRLREQKSDS